MPQVLAVIYWKYDSTSRYLKIFYNNGTGELYHPRTGICI